MPQLTQAARYEAQPIELCADQAFEQMAQGGDLFVNGDHFEALLFGVWIER